MLTEPVTILFVHAFPLDARMWRPQLEAFRTYRVLAPDLRGFGRNQRTPLFESVEQHAKDLIAVLDQHGVVHALVVGLSMGGYIALAMARLFPHRVAGLVLANTRAEPDSSEEQAQRVEMIAQVHHVGTSLLPNVMLPKLVAPACGDTTRNFLRMMMLEQPSAGVVAALRSLRNRPDARGGLFQIHCPIALVGGQLDILTPPSMQQSIADEVPGARLTILPNAGHLTNLEASVAFNQVVMDTYERVRQTAYMERRKAPLR
ncbi:MAG TPA: alpha/beta fold hydrolase [Polyangiaceae bacterium]|jgi:pimeloyl-ACP methyl ester carboxylesterase|nr:MAG: putative non-heme bromoperoxidase BpoC [Deltaproteobacteria bacterium ADurb.Bin207]HNS98937.1 alpha/beta fold hydrolase [Polyangiaceae bacterium]HNZ23027.1 alpha/beta fold hydrolase [Polyangiaceae bacterium]HOD21196.1 alpha/beta fold hydrolase [Polyangiaceae bacterium]HOE49040.1 alpha/beta fold hydrolase [Polyangiaceae bacterium]